MGLTIHYGLKLSADKTMTEAKEMVEALRQKCLDMPFSEVGELQVLKGNECDWNKVGNEDSNRWMLIQSQTYVEYQDGYRGIIQPTNGDRSFGKSHMGVSPKTIIAFSVWPGEGCEEANIGVCLYPKTIMVESRYTNKNYRLKVPNSTSHSWESFCKTQYASNPECGGISNFLSCHLMVINMLDKAKELGFEVNCSDEGGFYEGRDVEKLTNEIAEWNEYIASFGGQLKDIFEESEFQVSAQITKYPNFEHLEADGEMKHNTINPELIISLKNIAKKVQEKAQTILDK